METKRSEYDKTRKRVKEKTLKKQKMQTHTCSHIQESHRKHKTGKHNIYIQDLRKGTSRGVTERSYVLQMGEMNI